MEPARSIPIPARRGQVLVFVLLLMMLLAGIGAFLIWSGTSEYSQTARAVAAERAEQSARSAVDEALVLFDRSFSARPGQSSALFLDCRRRLFKQLAAAVEAAAIGPAASADCSSVGLRVDLAPELEATRHLVSQVPGGALKEASAEFHGFRPVTYPWAAGFADPKAFYRETVFGDEKRDPVPRDFQGYLTLRLTVAAQVAGQTVLRQLASTHDVKVQDVTPPAREFALFSYGPPPNEDYAHNDLNRGGELAVFPKNQGRVFVRGPLFLQVEDAGDPASMGGPYRREPSVTFPEVGKRDWHGWAAIPTNRAVRMPNFMLSPGELLDTIVRLASGAGLAAFTHPPQRPEHEMPFLGHLKIPIVNMSLPGVFLLGLAPTGHLKCVAGQVGLYQPLPPDEQLAIALNWAYLTGSVPRGKQTFSITGLPAQRLGGEAAAQTVQMYRGVLVKADGMPKPQPYASGVDLPRTGYADGQGPVEDMDSILPEPYFYQEPGKPLDLAEHDHGIYGVYRIATYDRYVYAVVDLGPLLKMIPGANLVLIPAVTALKAAGMMVALIPLHYKINGPPELTDKSTRDLEPEAWEQYFFAPYGLHYDSGHNQSIWGELATDVATIVVSEMMKKLVDGLILGRLFSKPGGKDPAAILSSQKPGDRLSSKVSSYFTGIGRDSSKVHGLLRHMVKRFGERVTRETGRDVLQVLLIRHALRSTLKAGLGYGFGTATGIAMVKLRRAVIGNYLRGLSMGEALQSPKVTDLARDFPKGFYPPKYRPWHRSATRVFASFQDFAAASGGDELDVTGVTLLCKLDFDGQNRVFTYRGRGVLIAVGDASDVPKLNIRLRPADADSHLTLAYENLSAAGGEGNGPQLALGTDIQATVYATNGVKPAGDVTRILGNLVTFHLQKSNLQPDSKVHVFYDPRRLPPSQDRSAHQDWWTVSVSPRPTAQDDLTR